jgi:hypothetical protein
MMLAMAYDEDLADRIRSLLADEPDLSEMRMFGGLAFLLAGNMSVAASDRFTASLLRRGGCGAAPVGKVAHAPARVSNGPVLGG